MFFEVKNTFIKIKQKYFQTAPKSWIYAADPYQ